MGYFQSITAYFLGIVACYFAHAIIADCSGAKRPSTISLDGPEGKRRDPACLARRRLAKYLFHLNCGGAIGKVRGVAGCGGSKRSLAKGLKGRALEMMQKPLSEIT